MNKTLRWVIGVCGVLILLALLNVLLVGGQYLWHYGDRQRLGQIGGLLDGERAQLQRMESQLDSITADLSRSEAPISEVRAQIDQTEASYPLGVPRRLRDAYSAALDLHNSLVERHNAGATRQRELYDQYSARADAYNALVAEADSLARMTGTTWSALPVPRIGGATDWTRTR